MDHSLNRNAPVWLDAKSCSLEEFKHHVERQTTPAQTPLADDIQSNIPIYDAARFRDATADTTHGPETLRDYMAEWNQIFATGPGIIAIQNAIPDSALIDEVTKTLSHLIAQEEAQNAGKGDHFAPAGANSRLWNSHEKLCLAAPELFARYNAGPIIPLVSQAWLGPFYQITCQVNVVRPGGQAQTCHRDYHMGFQTEQALTQYPAHIHTLSAALTLQGAIAHCDMPIESGPTKLLPYSATYQPGYIAALQPEFRDYFEQNHVQLPLKKGDAMFFNPATFHAAGENKTTNIERFANLMQIGSGYARSIEQVNRRAMSKAIYPVLKQAKVTTTFTDQETKAIIAAAAEGYPFPTNLDIDSPLSGMAPESQQELMARALSEGWEASAFEQALSEMIAHP